MSDEKNNFDLSPMDDNLATRFPFAKFFGENLIAFKLANIQVLWDQSFSI